jgi:hypothetical protein
LKVPLKAKDSAEAEATEETKAEEEAVQVAGVDPETEGVTARN